MMGKHRLTEWWPDELTTGEVIEVHSGVLFPQLTAQDLDQWYQSFAESFRAASLRPIRMTNFGKTAVINSLRSKEYELERPIAICIEEENDLTTATWFDVGQYGSGPSEDDAISDLCSVIIDYFRLLASEEANLSESLRGHLICLKEFVKARDAAQEI